MNASYSSTSASAAAANQGKAGGGPGAIGPKMLEDLAKAAARGRLGDQHMRAFAELCRTRPEARDMYQRELALINMQNGQQQMAAALGNRANTGFNPPAQVQPQPPQQQQSPSAPSTNSSSSSSTSSGPGNASLAQIAQIGPEQLLDLNLMLSKQMAESSACQQQASNPSLPQKEREALLGKALELRNRIMPIANLLNKTGLYKNVDASTVQAREGAIETMRILLTRYKTAMAAVQQGRTDSPASTAVAQPGGFGSPSQSPNPNAAGRQVAPLPQQARQTRTGGTAGPSAAAPSAQQAKVNLPPAIQNQYSAIAQQQQQHSQQQQTNQQAQVALTAAAAAAAAAASAAAAANAGAPSSGQTSTPQPSVTPTPTPGPTTAMNRVGSQERAAFPAPRASLTGGHAHGSSMSAGAVYKPPVNGVVDALSGHAAAGGGVGGAGPGGIVGGAGPSDGSGQGGVRDGGARPAGVGDREAGRVVTKRKIQELVESIDPNERLDPEVEDMFLEIADEFIDSVTRFGCQLAKHRKSERLECKDIQLHLERAWNIRIPGFANDEIRQSQSRRVNAAPAYQARVASVREELKRRRGGGA